MLLRVTHLWSVSLKVLCKGQDEISICLGWFLRSQVIRDTDSSLRIWGGILEAYGVIAVGTEQKEQAQKPGSSCLVAKLCLTLCNPMDCNLPGSSVHRISQARVLQWVSISSSRGSSWPRDRSHVFCIVGGFFTTEPSGKTGRPGCKSSFCCLLSVLL